MKYSLISLLFVLSLSFTACNQTKKEKDQTNQFDRTGKMYEMIPETTSVFWTGYKTTDKIAVKGQFMKLEFENIKAAPTAREALNGIQFSIPVSSLFSNEESRDTKLKENFFAVMDHTDFISGSISVENDSVATANIKMNGIEKAIPLSYFIDGQMLSMQGSFILDDFNALAALASLHEVCKDKHAGADGVSKTWNEVGINVESYLKVK